MSSVVTYFVALPASAGDRGDRTFCHLAAAIVAMSEGVPVGRLFQATRGTARLSVLRQAAMYLAHVVFGISLTRVGICFGRDRTTVRHGCALIEDLRDDPSADRAMAALEADLIVLAGLLPTVRPDLTWALPAPDFNPARSRFSIAEPGEH